MAKDSAALPPRSAPGFRGHIAGNEAESSHGESFGMPPSSASSRAREGSESPPVSIPFKVGPGSPGWTILHTAAYQNNIDGIRRFLSNGYDPNCQTSETRLTPLMIAAPKDHGEICSLLLEGGAASEMTAIYHLTAYDFAITFKYEETAIIIQQAMGNTATYSGTWRLY